MDNIKKDRLIGDIVQLELEMFLKVRSKEKASCQENPNAFKFYRTTGFSTWSLVSLESYLQDLKQALSDDVNLVTIKYAVMEGLIPKKRDNQLREKIVKIEIGWVKELASRYPYLHMRARPIEEDSSHMTSMKTYLAGELETYSDRTIQLYYENLQCCLAAKKNLAEQKLLAMVKGSGFSSLEQAEETLKRKEKLRAP